LIHKGIKSRSWLAWQIPILTNGLHKNSRIYQVNKKKIFRSLKNDEIPIIAGFQGVNSSERSSNSGSGPSSLGDKFMQFANKMASVPKIGGVEEEVHFMVKWIRPDVIDEKMKRMDETGVLKEIPTL